MNKSISTERQRDSNLIHLWYVRIINDAHWYVDDQLCCHFVALAQHLVLSLFGNFCTRKHTEIKEKTTIQLLENNIGE